MNTDTEIITEDELEEFAAMIADHEAQQSADNPLWMYGLYHQ